LFKKYYTLTKPGIIYGNALTTAAGFLFAARGHASPVLFLATLLGISLVIASACVFNNYIDRDIDHKMARTKNRALVSGDISVRNALTYGVILGLAGFAVLTFHTNLATALLAFIGFFFYVVMYSIWKRRSVHGTLVGTISGAMPIAVGYVAVTGRFDTGAFILFMIMVVWQMPHFYAIAIYRLEDYRHAGIPVLPVKKGIPATKSQMLSYILAFLAAASALTIYGYAGYTYFVVMLVVSLMWLRKAIAGFKKHNDDARWARGLFGFSLVVLMTLSVMLSLNVWLP